MLHKLTIGHLDPVAVAQRRVVVTRPLDTRIVKRLLGEFCEIGAAGRPAIGGLPVELHDGYLVCPWLMPGPVPGVAEFALRFQDETGCLLAEVGAATVVDRDLWLSQSYPKREPQAEQGPPGPGQSRRPEPRAADAKKRSSKRRTAHVEPR